MKRAKIETTHLAFRKLKWVIYGLTERTHCKCESSELSCSFCVFCVLCPFPLQFHIDCIQAVEQCPPNSSF